MPIVQLTLRESRGTLDEEVLRSRPSVVIAPEPTVAAAAAAAATAPRGDMNAEVAPPSPSSSIIAWPPSSSGKVSKASLPLLVLSGEPAPEPDDWAEGLPCSRIVGKPPPAPEVMLPPPLPPPAVPEPEAAIRACLRAASMATGSAEAKAALRSSGRHRPAEKAAAARSSGRRRPSDAQLETESSRPYVWGKENHGMCGNIKTVGNILKEEERVHQRQEPVHALQLVGRPNMHRSVAGDGITLKAHLLEGHG